MAILANVTDPNKTSTIEEFIRFKDDEFWCYRGSDLKSHSIQTLKKIVEA